MGRVVTIRSLVGEGSPAAGVEIIGGPGNCRRLVRGPQLAELRAFCAAVDLGSISGAARLLHVSQPALSKRLRTLERLLGTSLLVRSTRGVTVTSSGRRLYAAARRLLAEADGVEALMGALRGGGEPARIASSPVAAELWLPGILGDVNLAGDGRPAIELTIASSATVRRMVCAGACDVGVTAVDEVRFRDGLMETVVWETDLVVAVPPEHRWAELTEIGWEEFALAGVPPLEDVGNTTAAIAIARASGSPVLLPSTIAHTHDFVVRRVQGQRLRHRFALVHAGPLDGLAPHARMLADRMLAPVSACRPDAETGRLSAAVA